MTYEEALERNKAVDRVQLQTGDLVYVDGWNGRNPLTGEYTDLPQGFLVFQPYEGPPFLKHGIQLHPSPDLIGMPPNIEGRVYLPPFPTNSEAKDWVLRETMGTLYDPDQPRNIGDRPKFEY